MMAKVMQAWAVGIGGSAQANLMGELDEGPAQAPLRHTDTAFGEEEARALRARTEPVARSGISTQCTLCGGVYRDVSRLSKLGVSNGEDALGQVYVITVKMQRLVSAHAGDGVQPEQGGMGVRAQSCHAG